MRYVCSVCGYVYDEDVEGVPFADLPDSWSCPMCGAPKGLFEPEEVKEEKKAEPERTYRKYVCSVCGYVYDEKVEGVPFDELPDTWTCPMCGAPKGLFELQEAPAEEPVKKAGRKYVCSVCGYVYDEDVEGVPFDDLPDSWTCPMCGAPKGLFELKEDKPEPAGSRAASPSAAPAAEADMVEEWKKLDNGEISALFSNLARGAEKQYQAEAGECFRKVAAWYEKHDEKGHADMDHLAELVRKDLDEDYRNLKKEAERIGDRGTQRALTWGSKVTMIAKSLIDRYKTEGEGMLRGTSLWMCTVCGFMYIGDVPPEICPVCKVPSWKFERIGGR